MFSIEEIEKQKQIDNEDIARRWDALESAIRERYDDATAKKIRYAFEDFYRDMYSEGDIANWLANLYDHEIGGFYYSNSARDNEGFLPDLESTRQALYLIFRLGAPEVFGSVGELYPDWMKERILRFTKGLQDENGYFYHPQWERSLTDSKPHRRGRDLNWAGQIFEWFGGAPTYDTPSGVKGDGLLADGTPVKGFSHRESEVVAPKEEFVTPHLKNREAFEEYLAGFDLKGNSYVVSNALESQGKQIFERDKVLREMGADYSLTEILLEWFRANQDPKTGLFTHQEPDCTGVNGMLKACGAINYIQKPFPNPLRALESAISMIEGGDYEVTSVCDVLNPWYGINQLLKNISLYGDSSEDTEKYKKYIFDHVPEMMMATKKRILQFKKPDGSFSFGIQHSSPTSQGHPVAVKGSYEGDVNATNIGAAAIIAHIFNLVGVEIIPVLTLADKMRVTNIFEEKRMKAGL